jgi:hypothetical protein
MSVLLLVHLAAATKVFGGMWDIALPKFIPLSDKILHPHGNMTINTTKKRQWNWK